MAKYRVKVGAAWQGLPAGSIVETEPSAAAIVPWCLESVSTEPIAETPPTDEKITPVAKGKKSKP